MVINLPFLLLLLLTLLALVVWVEAGSKKVQLKASDLFWGLMRA